MAHQVLKWRTFILTDGWRHADMLVASHVGIFVGTPLIEDALAELQYEHIYDAAIGLAKSWRCEVEIRDAATNLPCVRFDKDGKVAFPVSLHEEQL